MSPLAASPEMRALAEKPVVTGAELETATNAAELIVDRNVFGRVSPWQKVEVVAALKDAGRKVAMLGDGVNDVLAIKNAHLGIAMGEGTRAAKTVSGIVLTTNRFDLLPATLEEGRTILRNLRRAGKLFLVKNVYMLILIVGSLMVFNLPFPLRPGQVTLLNFLTIGTPVLLIALGRERAAASREGFVREVGSFALRTGVVIGAAGMALHAYSARVRDDDADTQRTLLLTALVLLGLTSVLRVLSDGEPKRLTGDRKFYWLALAAVLLYLIALYTPPVGDFFYLVPLSFDQWELILNFVLPAIILILGSDILFGRHARLREAIGLRL
jgi:cation-transporting ATPase E